MGAIQDQFEKDLQGMINVSDFGTNADYTAGNEPAITITVDYRAPYSGPSMGDSVIESTRPTAICRTVDVPDVAHGDTLVIDAVTYTVIGIQPDGNGITVLELKV